MKRILYNYNNSVNMPTRPICISPSAEFGLRAQTLSLTISEELRPNLFFCDMRK